MKHFKHLSEKQMEDFFYKKPKEFNKNTNKKLLSIALGATLYMPADKEGISDILISKKYPSLTAMVMCLEDAIGDSNVEKAEDNIYKQLGKLKKAINEGELSEEDLPLLFVRVRNTKQTERLLLRGNELNLLSGFVLPKFNASTGVKDFEMIQNANEKYGTNFYAMPILESGNIIYKENRVAELMRIKEIFDAYRELILNIRIGATDFSSLYSIRRGIDLTIYDIAVIRDCLVDILNIFNRAECRYIISGPVWEYFTNHNRMLKPTLRKSLFNHNEKGMEKRKAMINEAIDGLIKEIILDKANGFVGKTIIHPTHIKYVNALQSVTQEEYEDAKMILEVEEIGVIKSNNGNKMNEVKPHTNWALNVMKKSEIYGVIKNEKSYTDLF